MPSPTWYDVLDVDPDATNQQVRAAWKAAIADLDPTDRRFRVVNEAAEVLLDPERRTAYDAELAGRAAAVEPPVRAPATAAGAPAGTTATATQAPSETRSPAPTESAPTESAPSESAPSESARPVGGAGRRVPAWALAALALLAAAAVAAAGWQVRERAEDRRVLAATEEAQAAAVPAAEAVLSYGFETLDEDQAAARSYLTDGYREKYDGLFEVIRQNAPTTETTVRAEVVASGVVRSGEDRVQVLLFVNQTRTNATTEKGGEPTVFKNWATVTLTEVDGDWLVDEMTSTPAGG